MQSKTAAILVVALFALVCTSLAGCAIVWEMLYAVRPDITMATVIVLCMGIMSWVGVYVLCCPDEEAKQIDPDLLAYQAQKEAEHASFLVWQSEKDAKEKADLLEYQQRNKYSC